MAALNKFSRSGFESFLLERFVLLNKNLPRLTHKLLVNIGQ